jgi:uncharacterized hydantoinase/oxoprolinase family protein
MKKTRTIYLPESVWELIDKVAWELKCSRSSTIRFAILTLAKDLSLLESTIKSQDLTCQTPKLRKEGFINVVDEGKNS